MLTIHSVVLVLLAMAALGLQAIEERYREAARLYEEGKLPEAEQVLRQILRDEPSFPPARFQLGAVCLAQGQVDEARALFEGLASQYASSSEIVFQVAVVYFLAEDLVTARTYLNRVLELDPRHPEATLTLGQLEGLEGNDEQALALLGDATVLSPSDVAPHYYRAAILDRLGRHGEAADALQEALRVSPHDGRLLRFLGAVYVTLEQWPHAVSVLEEAIRNGAVDPDVYLDLGRAHLGQEQLAPARTAFEKSLELKRSAEPLLQLGYIAWRLSDYDRAVWLLEECIALDPDLMRAYHFLGLIALRKGELQRAERYFLDALARDQGFAEAQFNLGKITLRQGKTERAVELFLEAVKSSPDYK
ncbi:MAG TPA: tetratricopeptide repeat protein, partial [Vicinamibacteria bacterium]|nr:tetratricopeptide repeat protein [Vicinamibacteria bacterium]